MLNIVVNSDFATLTNDLILLDRLLNSQIHEFSQHIHSKGCTSQMDGIWGLHASCPCCHIPIVNVQCVID